VDDPTDGTPRVATYEFTPPGGSWDPADDGPYSLSHQPDQIADAAGNFAPPGVVGQFTVAMVNAVTVQAVSVNAGAAQRSTVRTIDAAVTLPANPADAFDLRRHSDNAAVTLSAAIAGNTVTLTFTGGPVVGGSLADGRYSLTVLAAQILNLDGNGDGTPGDDYLLVGTTANGLFRLFGDVDGDVDAADFGQFRQRFGTSI
jgi:hypothetical protein